MILAKFNMNEKKTNVDMNEKKTNHIRSRTLFLSGARLCGSATQPQHRRPIFERPHFGH
jgi:hypothetical protein